MFLHGLYRHILCVFWLAHVIVLLYFCVPCFCCIGFSSPLVERLLEALLNKLVFVMWVIKTLTESVICEETHVYELLL